MTTVARAMLEDREATVLGSILRKPSTLPDLCADPGLSPEDFSLPLHRKIYSTILDLQEAGTTPDAGAVADHYPGKVDPLYLTQLIDAAPVASLAKQYAEDIRLEALKSQLSHTLDYCHTCHELVEKVQIVTESFTVSQSKYGYVTAQVQKFVDDVEGSFTTTDVYNHLSAQDAKTKAAIRQALNRFKKENVVEVEGSRSGRYRKVQHQFEVFDIGAASAEPFDFELPFNLSGSEDSLIELNPREIVLVAGQSNAGKTTLLIHTLTSYLLNLKAFKSKDRAIRYGSSEMGPAAMARKVRLYGEEAFRLWCEHVEIIGLSANYQDAILPDGINFIDYIQPPEGDHTMMSHTLTQIHDKLNTGIAIIANQLRPGCEAPEGGWGMVAKPRNVFLLRNIKGRLYQTIEIHKAKHPLHGQVNGKCLDFVVKGGAFLQAISPWGFDSQLKRGRLARTYVDNQPAMPTFKRGQRETF